MILCDLSTSASIPYDWRNWLGHLRISSAKTGCHSFQFRKLRAKCHGLRLYAHAKGLDLTSLWDLQDIYGPSNG